MNATLVLRPGREKSVLQRHPWIFASAIQRIDGEPSSGETVRVLSAEKKFLAWAAYSPESQIRARIWTWQEDQVIDADFLTTRLRRAICLRDEMIPAAETNAYRLVHGESDGLPGLVVDRYDQVLVVQILSAGPEYWKEVLFDELVELTACESIYERSDVDVRSLEGLAERRGLVRGKEIPERLKIQEHGLSFWVDVAGGQKTGFYLDQRRNRARVGSLVKGKSVLNCFCYTGAFTAYALAGGASEVLSVDSSADALQAGAENLRLNQMEDRPATWMEGDVFHLLRKFRDEARKFDAIILDPPKFAPTSAQADRAARGYKDINLLALKLLRPGGLLFTFSCSGGISAELFQKIVAGAALDAGLHVNLLEIMHQGVDHPVALNFPEGAYLKGLICRVDG